MFSLVVQMEVRADRREEFLAGRQVNTTGELLCTHTTEESA